MREKTIRIGEDVWSKHIELPIVGRKVTPEQYQEIKNKMNEQGYLTNTGCIKFDSEHNLSWFWKKFNRVFDYELLEFIYTMYDALEKEVD